LPTPSGAVLDGLRGIAALTVGAALAGARACANEEWNNRNFACSRIIPLPGVDILLRPFRKSLLYSISKDILAGIVVTTAEAGR
jgi:hypothetical protein